MKRKPVEVFTLRDPGGHLIHAARVAAAKQDMSINTWLLQVIEAAVTEPTEAQERPGEAEGREGK